MDTSATMTTDQSTSEGATTATQDSSDDTVLSMLVVL